MIHFCHLVTQTTPTRNYSILHLKNHLYTMADQIRQQIAQHIAEGLRFMGEAQLRYQEILSDQDATSVNALIMEYALGLEELVDLFPRSAEVLETLEQTEKRHQKEHDTQQREWDARRALLEREYQERYQKLRQKELTLNQQKQASENQLMSNEAIKNQVCQQNPVDSS
jgi:hypothetical protein